MKPHSSSPPSPRAIDNFYNDDATAYIVTSDHGMTSWGTHGSGHTNETQCPFVAWGAGINKGRPVRQDKEDKLNNWERRDLWQADIAVLMSTLIGKHLFMSFIFFTLDQEWLYWKICS